MPLGVEFTALAYIKKASTLPQGLLPGVYLRGMDAGTDWPAPPVSVWHRGGPLWHRFGLRLRHYAYLENTLQKTAQALGLEDLYQVIYGRLSDFDYTSVEIFDDYLAPEIGGSHKGQLCPRDPERSEESVAIDINAQGTDSSSSFLGRTPQNDTVAE